MISSHPNWDSYKDAPITGNWLKRWLKSRFRFVDYPFLQTHRGFGNAQSFILQGHVFRGMSLTRPRKRYSPWKNFVSLIKMFLVRTVPEVRVELRCGNQKHVVKTNAQGFFEFELPNPGWEMGWHKVKLRLVDELVEGQEKITVKGEVYIADRFEYGLISDIDDTFLVSHITKRLRKLYVLLTKNAETRKPFKGVVAFYNELQQGVDDQQNPFFYVSSSEWNLYDFLINFTRVHHLPKGVLQLKEIKDSLSDFFDGNFKNHDHKRLKIKRILDLHKERSFILLGDNGQHDPLIYEQIVKEYPSQIKAVYIRGVNRANRPKTQLVLNRIAEHGIPVLQFRKSEEAREHARFQGFI